MHKALGWSCLYELSVSERIRHKVKKLSRKALQVSARNLISLTENSWLYSQEFKCRK